jgi:hypothetical protein
MTPWYRLIVTAVLLLLVCSFGENSSWGDQLVDVKGHLIAKANNQTALVGVIGERGFAVQTQVPPESVLIRFTKAEDGVITDHAANLEWYVGPDKDTTWYQTKAWTESLTVAGGGWRLPTVAELKTLYKRGASLQNMDPIFQTSGFYIWSVQRDASSAWLLNFALIDGREHWDYLDGTFLRRAFAVRSRK